MVNRLASSMMEFFVVWLFVCGCIFVIAVGATGVAAIVFAILILILLGWIAFLLRFTLIQYRDMKLSMQQQERDRMTDKMLTLGMKRNEKRGNLRVIK